MIDRIVTFSVERRWFVLLVTAIAAIIGGWALARLPIDAVPDITNNQVVDVEDLLLVVSGWGNCAN